MKLKKYTNKEIEGMLSTYKNELDNEGGLTSIEIDSKILERKLEINKEMEEYERMVIKVREEERKNKETKMKEKMEAKIEKELMKEKQEQATNAAMNDFIENRGKLSADKRLLYSYTHNNWIMIDEKKEDIEIIQKIDAVKAHISHFYPGANAGKIAEYGKTSAYLTFNPKSAFETYDDDGYMTINLYNEKHTKLGMVSKLLEMGIDRKKGLDFLDKYPHTKLLMTNVFNSDNIEYVVNWLSTIVNEQNKINTTLLIKSDEGPGKGVFTDKILRKIFGKYLVVANNQILNNDRNELFENKLFVVFNEVKTDVNSGIDAKIKELITDDRLIIRRMYSSPVSVLNLFNTIFFTNEENAIKIGVSNRRLSVIDLRKYNTKKLQDIVSETFGINMTVFLKKLDEEFDGFFSDLILYDYSLEKANSLIQNSEVKNIIERTSTKEEKLKGMLMRADFDAISEKIYEYRDLEVAVQGNVGEIEFDTCMNNLLEEMTAGYLKTDSQVFLYKYFLIDDRDKNLSVRKIGTFFTSMIGSSVTVSIDGKKVRVRKLPTSYKGEVKKETIVKEYDNELVNLYSKPEVKDEVELDDDGDEIVKTVIEREKKDAFISRFKSYVESNVVDDYNFNKNAIVYFKEGNTNVVLDGSLSSAEEDELLMIVVPF